MTKCVFCGKEEPDFLGVHLIKNDGNVDFFCSSKCRKNTLNLGRDKRKIKWTEAYRLGRAKADSDVARLKVKDAEAKVAKAARAVANEAKVAAKAESEKKSEKKK